MARTLRDELKQGKPFRSLGEETALNIARTSAVLDHAFTQALKPYEITPTQYNVLRILRGAGDIGLCRNEVGERLIRAVPDVTRLLDRMEELKLIERMRGTEDRRFVSTHLTPKGLELVERLDREVDAMHRQQLGHLTDVELRQLVALLTAVRSGQSKP